MNLVHEDNTVLIKGIKNRGSITCSISFTGVGHAMGGINVQSQEFVGSCIALGDALFISDKMRSWGNSIDIRELKNVFNQWQNDSRYEKLVALGNSMGGTNALLVGPYLGARTIVAFAPQYSVHSDYFPDLGDSNWEKYRNEIKTWKFKTVDSQPRDTAIKEYIFSGGSAREIEHAKHFQSIPQRSHYIIKDSDHGVAMYLKKNGCLPEIIELATRDASNEDIERALFSKDIAFTRQA